MSVEDVRTRAERTLEECIKHGTTRMRTQVEVDPGIGMRGFEGVQSLIADYKWAIDIEICVFPQEGLISYPGTEELLVEGLKRGARVIGGAPRYDTDEAGQIQRIFELAREFDVDIDMHLDVGPTPDAMNIHLVRELTDKYQRGGRVVVGHMAKLSLHAAGRGGGAGAPASPIQASRSPCCRRRTCFSWAATGIIRPARRGRRQSAGRARRELLAFLQQHSQSGDALRRLLARSAWRTFTPTCCRSIVRGSFANAFAC